MRSVGMVPVPERLGGGEEELEPGSKLTGSGPDGRAAAVRPWG